MKHHEPSQHDFLNRSFERFRDMPSDQIQSACDRVLDRLRDDHEPPLAYLHTPIRRTNRLAVGLAAAALIVAVVFSAVMVRRLISPIDAYAVAETGQKFGQDEPIRSNSATNTILTLRDGSRVEMRSNSELALEPANDGVRIRLKTGSVIVTAAKQDAGHLYVQTKDVTVSVVGTIFLVNTEAAGSRVAVIQGEVKVSQGETEKDLHPGEAVASNPVIALPPVSEEISWSRHVEEHLAVLQQAAAPTQVAAAPKETRIAFEVVSIRPAGPPPGGGRRGGPGTADNSAQTPPRQLCLSQPRVQLDPGRFTTTSSALDLIAMAYGKRACSYILGVPDWAGADRFDVQATVPQGSPVYTVAQLRNGNASRLQIMLQTLLAERFHLELHRETKEMPVFNLVVAKEGKMVPMDEQIPPDLTFRPSLSPNPGPGFSAGPISLQGFADLLTGAGVVDRPVIDKTGLKGAYGMFLTFPEMANSTDMLGDVHARIPAKLQEEYGLKLEPARGPVEFLVIDHLERPSEN